MTLPRDINYTMNQLIARRPFGEVDVVSEDVMSPVSRAINSLLLGGTSRTSTSSGKTATVKAGEDIRPALNSLKSAGGGTLILLAGVHKPTYDIVGDSKINIIGEGIDQTIIDFGGGSYSVKYTGPTGSLSTYLKSFTISKLTIKNSGTYGIDVNYVQNFLIEYVNVSDCTSSGFRIGNAWFFTISNCVSYSNQHGFLFDPNGGWDSGIGTIQNCRSLSNSSRGFYVYCNTGSVSKFSFINCSSSDSTYGIEIYSYDVGYLAYNISLISCNASATHAFVIKAYDFSLVACSQSAGSYFIEIDDSFSLNGRVIGCHSYGISSFAGDTVVIGSSLFQNLTVVPYNEFTSTYDKSVTSIGIKGGSLNTEKNVLRFKNASGGTLTAGQVVVFSPSALGDEMTTTTTQGDDYVLGMVLESIGNTYYGNVVLTGYTKALKVDGTTDIAVGDFLCTFTTAGISAKAGAGDMAFAIALEAYTTNDSNGVIDALLITPRKL